jgi:2-C-methyl-D-erythritol 4-phosphate cytidylyltransferase
VISYPRLRTVAVVLAGGVGTRVGLGIPKQLLKIAGKPVIAHTLALFEAAPEVDEVIVLMTPGYVEDVQEIVADGGFEKVSRVIEGGATRNESTRNALEALGSDECNVLFHDAVRPLLSQSIIAACVEALRDAEAVDVVIPSADTIVEVDDHGVVVDIPDRSRLRRGQTPQGFRLSTIRRAYELAWQDPAFTATDDCTVVLRYLPEVEIRVVDGNEANIKITAPVDLFIADKLFQIGASAPEPSLPLPDVSDRLDGRVAVVLGGSHGIGGEIVSLLRSHGVRVFAFSRSTTGTFVQNPSDIAAALSQAASEAGHIDYVVLTAGVLRVADLADTDDATVREMIDVNYVAPVNVARLAAPYLQTTRGHLLLFASSSYTRGRAGYSLYSSCKAAVVNLTQALADEWADIGVRVNCIKPERTATSMRTEAFGEEPADTLLDAALVARVSVDVLIGDATGSVVDVSLQLPSLVGSR